MPAPALGVVILCYRSADVVGPCLTSLLASDGPALHVVVVDNDSPDDTVATIRTWAVDNDVDLVERKVGVPGTLDVGPLPQLTLLRSGHNRGFAAGVNAGLRTLLEDPRLGLFWVLNPDTVVEPGTAAAYCRMAGRTGPFAIMGGRTLYWEPPNLIQSDGGQVSRWTGVCRNVNQGLPPSVTPPPEAGDLDFISGANMVASRPFIETVGLMREDYFLYYEEVDWAFRRGHLPLLVCPDAIIRHHGGTTIGTGSVTRRASAFANYYNFRNRIRFVARFMWHSLPASYAYCLLKILQLVALGARDEAAGAFRGLHNMTPPAPPSSRSRHEKGPPAGRQVIVNFHGVGTPPPRVPDDERPYWLSEDRFRWVLDRIAELESDGHRVRITFDDGNASDVRVAAPALVERGLVGDFFVLTGRLGTEGYLSSDELRTLAGMGMGVGLHGQDHVDWRRLEADALHTETVVANGALEQALGERVTMVSVPFGAYDRRIMSHLRKLGFDEIHTSDGGTAPLGARVLARTSLRSDMGDDTVRRILVGEDPPVERVRRTTSAFLRRHVIGGRRPLPEPIRAAWARVMLRGTAFTGRYGKLRRLYSLEDPWDMASEREQYRFERTNQMLSGLVARDESILELGSGEGHQSRYLQLLADELVGIELSERAVERARSRCPDAEFLTGAIEQAPTLVGDRRFDLVVACEVLYYVPDLPSVLTELQERARRIFVSNYQPRSEVIRSHFSGEGWHRLQDIRHDDTVWECFLWEAPGPAALD